MNLRKLLAWSAAILVLVGLGAAGFLTRDYWQPFLVKNDDAPGHAEKPVEHNHGELQRVSLSAQAQANLNLIVKPVKLQSYWRSIEVPGMVIDRPGRSDRGISAPVTGVVKAINALPGDTVRPGEALFTLRIVSESFLTSQTELFKNQREWQAAKERRERLGDASKGGNVPPVQLADLDSQLRRLSGTVQAYRADLQARGLTQEQVDGIADGRFVTEITVYAPKIAADSKLLVSRRPVGSQPSEDLAYEIQELKVQMGDQVQAGQLLGLLANHQNLLIEGRSFRHETGLIEKAAQEGWPLQADFVEDQTTGWPPLEQSFQILYLSNTLDAASRTFPFYIPVTNNARPYEKDGKTYIVWRFRPGQRVRLRVPVEHFQNVFVLPVESLVREGAEAFVFRQNGDSYERKAVHVLFEDRRNAVIANDGSLGAGWFVAQNAAASLNRILQAQGSGDEEGHGHEGHHHDH